MDIPSEIRVRQVALITFLFTLYLSDSHCSSISNATIDDLGVVQKLVENAMVSTVGSLELLCGDGIEYPKRYDKSTCHLYADKIVSDYTSEICGGNIDVVYPREQSLSLNNVQEILNQTVQHLKLQMKLLATVEAYMNETAKGGLALCRQAKMNVNATLTRPALRSVFEDLGFYTTNIDVEPPSLYSNSKGINNWSLGCLKISWKGLDDLMNALGRVEEYLHQHSESNSP